MKKILLKDVAEKAGVSIASVSYVLNNSPGNRISEETVNKVKQAARELNYRPNTIAKSLKTQRTFTIGLLVADIANPYFSHMARLVEDEARKYGYTLLIGSCDENKDRFAQLIDAFCDRQVDGLIITPVTDSREYLQNLSLRQTPFVLIDRIVPELKSISIHTNNYQISYQAASQLLTSGKNKPVFVDFDHHLTHLQHREDGFKAALADHHLKCTSGNLMKLKTEASDQEIDEAFSKVLAQPQQPDAFLFSSNKLAIKGLRFLRKMHVNIPADVAIIAFDESEAYDLFSVPISFIKQPMPEMCMQAMKFLRELIDQTNEPPSVTVIDAELILAASSLPR